MPLRMMMRLGGENELGLSNEQRERLSFLYKDNEIMRDLFIQMHANPTPEFALALEAERAAQLPDDPFFERATEEQKNALRKASLMTLDLLMAATQTEIEETLTSEQMLVVRKMEMQLMPEMGIPFPSMFDPLDLTDDQKAEMNRIVDEMKVEFDSLTQEQATLRVEQSVAIFGSLRGRTFASNEEFQRTMQEIHREFVPSEAMRRRAENLREQGTQFVTLLQNRLMNVLTDEQLDRMQQILDETPETVKQALAQMRAGREAQSQSPRYVPGPDSWRPGMPLPAQFRQERTRGNFPRPQ